MTRGAVGKGGNLFECLKVRPQGPDPVSAFRFDLSALQKFGRSLPDVAEMLSFKWPLDHFQGEHKLTPSRPIVGAAIAVTSEVRGVELSAANQEPVPLIEGQPVIFNEPCDTIKVSGWDCTYGELHLAVAHDYEQAKQLPDWVADAVPISAQLNSIASGGPPWSGIPDSVFVGYPLGIHVPRRRSGFTFGGVGIGQQWLYGAVYNPDLIQNLEVEVRALELARPDGRAPAPDMAQNTVVTSVAPATLQPFGLPPWPDPPGGPVLNAMLLHMYCVSPTGIAGLVQVQSELRI